jgi:hypothetical protein
MKVLQKWSSTCTGYAPVSDTRMVLVGTYKSKSIFIWLIQDGGYSKNVHLVEKYHKTFSFFYYILIIYLTFDENS